MYKACSTTHGVEGESSCIAEHIEHVSAERIMLEKCTVVTLVDKETCLLSLEPVYMEEQSVLHGYILCASAKKESVLGRFEVGLERQRGFTLIIDIADGIAHHFL